MCLKFEAGGNYLHGVPVPLTSVNTWRLAAINTPIGRLTWQMKSRRYRGGAQSREGCISLKSGCHPVVSLAAYLWPGRPGPSSTHPIIHSP